MLKKLKILITKNNLNKTSVIVLILLLLLTIPVTVFYLLTNTFDANTDASTSDIRTIKLNYIPDSQKVYAPFSGFYLWRAPVVTDSSGKCTGWKSNDNMPLSTDPSEAENIMLYNRFDWIDFEKTAGNYDFSLIDCYLNDPKSAGKQFGFSIRSLSTGSNIYNKKVTKAYPEYLEKKGNGVCSDSEIMKTQFISTNGNVSVPDWNSQCFLKRYKALMEAIAKKYDNNPRIGFIENRAYGNYGEWHMYAMNEPDSNKIKDTSLYALVDAVGASFKNTRVIMPTDNQKALIYAMDKYPSMGLKRDSLGHPHFVNGLIETDAKYNSMKDRWKVAPFVTEYFNPSAQSSPETFFEEATDQVNEYHVAMVGNSNAKPYSGMSSTAKAWYEKSGESAGMRYAVDSFTLPTKMNLGDTFTIDTKWTNEGNTPSYVPWDITYQLVDSSNNIVSSTKSSADLQSVDQFPLQTQVKITDVFALPKTMSAGKYTLQLVIKDPKNYFEPLRIANEGRNTDGSYTITTIDISKSAVSIPTPTVTQAPRVTSTPIPSTNSSIDISLNINSAKLSGNITRKDSYIEMGQGDNTDPSKGGAATFSFTVPESGLYYVSAKVATPSEAKNSVFFNLNAAPSTLMVWDLPVSKSSDKYISENGSWRGNSAGTDENYSDIDLALFTLNKGSNSLVISPREPNVRIKDIVIKKMNESSINTDSVVYRKAFNATSNLTKFTSPFTKSGTSIYAKSSTFSISSSGSADYNFNLDQPGLYIVSMKVSVPNTDSNSIFMDIDNTNMTDTNIWDATVTNGSEKQIVTKRGAGKSEDSSDQQTAFFTLFEGKHTLSIKSRESNMKIDTIYIEKIDLGSAFSIGQ